MAAMRRAAGAECGLKAACASRRRTEQPAVAQRARRARCAPIGGDAAIQVTALATLTALNPSRHGWVWNIAHSLVASSFYRRLVT